MWKDAHVTGIEASLHANNAAISDKNNTNTAVRSAMSRYTIVRIILESVISIYSSTARELLIPLDVVPVAVRERSFT